MALFLLVATSGAAALLPGCAQQVVRIEAPEQERSATELLKQAKHYLRKDMPDAAIRSLEQARRQSDGKRDPMVHYYLAKIYYDRMVLEKAVPLAARADELAKTEEQRKKTTPLAKALTGQFGGVTFKASIETPPRLYEGYIRLEDRGKLIGKQKRAVFDHVRDRFWEKPVSLPITLYLPHGDYAANRIPFTVDGERVETVDLVLYDPNPGRYR